MKHSPEFLYKLFKKFSNSEPFLKITSSLYHYEKPVRVSGLSGSSISIFIAALRKNFNNPFLIVLEDSKEAEEIRDDLDFLLDPSIVSLFHKPFIAHSLKNHFDSISSHFCNDTITKLLTNVNPVVVATIDGLSLKTLSPESLLSGSVTLKTNNFFSRNDFINYLQKLNYNREEIVEYPNEYCIKGGIVDLYPPESTNPYRIEFSDDFIESIRSFDSNSQLSVDHLDSVTIYPSIIETLEKTPTSSLPSFFNKDTITIIPHFERFKSLYDNSEKIHSIYLSIENSKHLLAFDLYKTDACFHACSHDFIDGKLSTFKTYLAKSLESFPKALFAILSDNPDQATRLETLLRNPSIEIISGAISHNVEIPQIGLFIYPEHEIFHRSKKSYTFKRLHMEVSLQRFYLDSISPGDFMVHINYGIGKYVGLQKLKAFGSLRECLVLEYYSGDNVFIPIERFSDVQLYRFSDSFVPKLNRLGTGEWEKTKARTRRSLEKITDELALLYASRLNSKGFAFDPDTDLQLEMESEFIYEETPDQVTATQEIKRDMEKPSPMDRLLCGDVGFGKTEVAIRASFKAVSNSKQVAVLVPTTILADQHHITFKNRLKNFPVNIAYLSRFIKKSKKLSAISGISDGKIDIVIGTQRLLSEDVSFKDLGLLIIDEEHRFGVKHKERIKQLFTHIDVLSLSATPIPRSLQMSLIGAREFSIINTPPESRFPIYTEIITFNKEIIRDAINREISRGGQVYFVHNDITTIRSMCYKISSIVPSISIAFAHGKMSEGEIVPIMRNFINGKIDLLVTTTIIESGIDIPNVNTIFINRAHMFGLSTLYQLRGRVGRGSRKAYSYFIIPNPIRLNHNAIKRLQTVERHTALGSGYDISLKDLEIRGAGNLFGIEQSGFIQAVGYELYIKILKESLEGSKNLDDQTSPDPVVKQKETEISCPIPAYFPDNYIGSQAVRLRLYKSLADANDLKTIDKIKYEISDQFGSLPAEGLNLLEISRVRISAQKLGITKMVLTKNNFHCIFSNLNPFPNNLFLILSIKEITEKMVLSYKFVSDENLCVNVFIRKNDIVIHTAKQFLYLLRESANL